jgi:excisionase family DNA binding protein
VPDELCTVDAAAERLALHPKTVLRHIREGRLRATKVGKAYRIRRVDLDAFAGIPADEAALAPDATPVGRGGAVVTSIVDVPAVGPELARAWGRAVTNALQAKPRDDVPLRADVVHDPDRAHLKLVITGSARDTSNLLGLVHVWLEQLTP